VSEDFKKLCSALKYWNIDLEDPRKSYQTRFILQKLAYISKALGYPLKYHFILYIKGPYSSSLTADYFNYPNFVSNQDLIQKFTKDEEIILKNVQKNIFEHGLMKEHFSEFLETLATITYIKKKYPSFLDDDLFVYTKKEKPYLKDWMITIGINVVKKILFSPDFLTEDVKREMELWDLADD